MKIVIASDSYKGSLSAWQVGTIAQRAIRKVFPEAEVEIVPMADGGEGTMETIVQAASGSLIDLTATGPLGEVTAARYGVLRTHTNTPTARDEQGVSHTAIIEVANIAGLTMVPEVVRNPEQTTTYGVGEVMLHALNQGCRKFIVGLGGSATNDGGMGLLQALGAVFRDASGNPVPPVGGALSAVTSVELDFIDARVWDCDIRVASDVDNPLCGDSGSSVVFGPQKGATPDQVKRLEAGLVNYAARIEAVTEKPLQNTPGAGAAGGLGFAFLLLNAELAPGAKLVGDAVGLEEKVRGADFVLTGEGQSDFQTLFGKVPYYVAQVAAKHGAKAILVSGGLGRGVESLYDHFVSLHSIVTRPMTLQEAMEDAETQLSFTVENIARLLNAR
ncbi:glycerate kinase [Alicyclobacillus sp. ALC3]|uniref:glycerate kinase n=1 Tax=Alicyclobacillus sp. ALC3 TaxID=2796143 RepID=UPI00237819E9|nr:glycerate kinase [Alicyclobacillus sp. ALC3]WDL95656.1 glycerate kinase [Alicyclobacillus sp. ALC3]